MSPLAAFEGDRLRVSDAQERYEIKKTTLNGRIKHVGIAPSRDGHATYLSKGDVQILDDLHHHLESGKGMSTFTSPIAEVVDSEDSGERSAIVRPERHSNPNVPVIIQGPPQELTAITRIQSLTETLEFLDKCAEKGWLLPTSDIRSILGTAPRRSGWTRYGYCFEAAGSHGNETAWAVFIDAVEEAA